MMDTLSVKLPYAASVGNTTLPAGQYMVRDLKDDGNESILEFTPAKGASVNVIMMQIATPNEKPAEHTQVVLRSEGNNKYQLDKIFLEGRDYGFELLK